MHIIVAMIFFLGISMLPAADTTDSQDHVFATVDGHDLTLRLTIPSADKPPPLVVYIHGGGWRGGSYKNCRINWVAEHGYALASIGYRLTDQAIFPAQIHDCKAAIRWLRANADTLGYDATRILVAGGSAGGHLAELLGTSNGVAELEGEVGAHLDQSSSVQAVISYFGLADFPLRHTTNGERHLSPTSGAYLLLGGTADKGMDPELERLASPVTWVGEHSAPMFVFHGTADKVVVVAQAHRIAEVYKEHGLSCEISLLEGGSHGDKRLFEGAFRQQALDFIARQFTPAD